MQIALCPCCGKPVRPKAVTPFSAGPLAWAYGSGFPKSHSISKAIDKAAGAEREVVGERVYSGGHIQHSKAPRFNENDYANGAIYQEALKRMDTAPATEAAALWDGWGTALKPAWEPVLVCMKPLDSTFAANALAHGVAGLWIDGARVATGDRLLCHGPSRTFGSDRGNYDRNGRQYREGGRWPANVALLHVAPDENGNGGCQRVGTRRVRGQAPIYRRNAKDAEPDDGTIYGKMNPEPANKQIGYADPDGLETIDAWQCVEGCPCRILGEQSGERASGKLEPYHNRGEQRNIYGKYNGKKWLQSFGSDTGTAARFFYQAKASRTERNAGCEDFYWKRDGKELVRIGREEWENLDERQRARGNIHPTVKPLGMLEYLCKLTRTPTGGVVFDPFIGSGTTAVAALKTGRHFYGCDINQDYVDLANARIEKTRLELSQMELAL